MIVAIIGSFLGGVFDYFNPKTRFLDWLAAWPYAAAALAWVDILSIGWLVGQVPNRSWYLWLRCILGVTGVVIILLLMNSLVTWKLPIFRKLVTPISDDVTGLGSAAHKGFNGRLMGCIAAAAILPMFLPPVAGAVTFVEATHEPVHALGNWMSEKVGVEWFGFPSDAKKPAAKPARKVATRHG